MKELGVTFKKFTSGLRPYSEMPIDESGLTECFGVIVRPQGLVSVPEIVSPDGWTSDYPFPQVFLGGVHWLYCTRTGVYKINGDWTLTHLITVLEGEVWQFADFINYGVLTNGVVTLVYNTLTSEWESCDGVLVPNLDAVCNYNGQILGAVGNSLLWGGIGVADFTVDQSNVRGNRVMPWTGEIYQIRKLGSGFVVYGDNGIVVCKFDGVTPGFVRYLRYGIISRGAVGGDDLNHTFVDTYGNLRSISVDFNVSEPTHQEFFSTMSGREVVVNYNPEHQDSYITDGVRGFIKTTLGVSETPQIVTGLDSIGGSVYGSYALSGAGIILVSDVLDFGSRGKKTINVIEMGLRGSGVSVFEISYDYKIGYNDEWESTEWVELNPQGWGVLTISGVEFRVKIRCSDATGVKIDYITLRIKFDDKRDIRGTNANSIAS